jgi:hypothetical protein
MVTAEFYYGYVRIENEYDQLAISLDEVADLIDRLNQILEEQRELSA